MKTIPSESQQVAIVGAGILGLAHAWHAARRGHRVTVFERHDRAQEASVRNFGMIWPIGQPPGRLHALALRSRELWLELARAADLWVNPCGSIHLAHRPDEWAVLEEFQQLACVQGIACQLLTPAEVHARTNAANPAGLLGGMFSPSELCVNPRRVPARLAQFLAEQLGVEFCWSTPVVEVATSQLRTASGNTLRFDQIVIASGSELKLLFPERFAMSGLRRCKLQMLKTSPPTGGWRLGPHLASGLTLRHYQSFAACASQDALRQRIAAETPELDRFGIHVMASQNDVGDIILGDSHEYENEIEPFQKSSIDELILRELRKVLCLPEWTIAERWEGIYVKHPTLPVYQAEPLPNVHLFTGVGGAGMTMSLGLAEQFWTPNIEEC